MTRKEIIKKLIEEVEIARYTDEELRNSKELKNIAMWFDDEFENFELDETNLCDDSWRSGYIVEFIFREEGIDMLAGDDLEMLANQDTWSFESWEDFTDEELLELYKLAQG